MSDRLLNVKEVADMIGFSRQGVYKLVLYNRIPYIRISKKAIRFRESDIKGWLDAKFRPAVK